MMKIHNKYIFLEKSTPTEEKKCEMKDSLKKIRHNVNNKHASTQQKEQSTTGS